MRSPRGRGQQLLRVRDDLGPLVLRVLAPHHDPLRAMRERATQNAVADMGFPAPRAPLASADPGLDASSFGDRLVTRFAELTGIRPGLVATND